MLHNEFPKIMADIAAEIEAKKAYRKALKTVRAMRKAGKERRGDLQMGERGMREGAKVSPPGDGPGPLNRQRQLSGARTRS
jgi:hypothetical protein